MRERERERRQTEKFISRIIFIEAWIKPERKCCAANYLLSRQIGKLMSQYNTALFRLQRELIGCVMQKVIFQVEQTVAVGYWRIDDMKLSCR